MAKDSTPKAKWAPTIPKQKRPYVTTVPITDPAPKDRPGFTDTKPPGGK